MVLSRPFCFLLLLRSSQDHMLPPPMLWTGGMRCPGLKITGNKQCQSWPISQSSSLPNLLCGPASRPNTLHCPNVRRGWILLSPRFGALHNSIRSNAQIRYFTGRVQLVFLQSNCYIGPCWHWTLADVSISPLQCSVEGIKNLKGADPLNWYSGSLSVNKWWDLEGSCRQQRRDGHGGDDPATVWLITALMIISVMTWPCHAGTLLAPGGWERQAWNKKTLQESKKLRLTSQIWNFWQISRCEIGLKSAWECHKSIGRGVGDFICKGQQSV